MRHLLVLAALAALSLPAHCATPSATPSETLAAFHQALSDGDATRAAALLSPDVEIYESGHVERSRAEYAAHHLASDIGYARATTSKVLRQSEKISGATAVVRRETETTGNFQGRPVHQFGVETAILDKNGEGWMISHVHWSSRKAK